MIHRILLTAVSLLLATSFAAFGQADPQRTESRMSSAIDIEARAQAKAEDWAVGKEDLVLEIRDVQTTIAWYEYNIKKYNIYIDRLNRNIDVLRVKKLEARRVREILSPTLKMLPWMVWRRSSHQICPSILRREICVSNNSEMS